MREAAAGEPVALMGSSMGGYVAALYAARHPEVTRLVLLAPAFGFARRWPERLGSEAVENWRRTGWMDVFHYADGRNRAISYALLEDGAQYEEYPDFAQPALIFHGAHDDVVPAELSRRFVAAPSQRHAGDRRFGPRDAERAGFGRAQSDGVSVEVRTRRGPPWWGMLARAVTIGRAANPGARHG